MPFAVSPRVASAAQVEFSPQAQLFNPEVIAGRGMVTIPAGLRVVGSPNYVDNPSRWVNVDAFRARTEFETEGQFQAVTGHQGREGAPLNHPVTCVSWRRSVDYIRRLNSGLAPADHFMLPTAVEAEVGIRGEARDILKFMEEHGLSAEQFIEYELAAQKDPGKKVAFENLVTELAANSRIYNIADRSELKSLLDSAKTLLGWQKFGTVDGLLNPDTAWYQRPGTTTVSPHKYISGYGVPGTGHVERWTGDNYDVNAHASLGVNNPTNLPRDDDDNSLREIRGGTWRSNPQFLPAAFRDRLYPDSDGYRFVGLWLASAASARAPT